MSSQGEDEEYEEQLQAMPAVVASQFQLQQDENTRTVSSWSSDVLRENIVQKNSGKKLKKCCDS